MPGFDWSQQKPWIGLVSRDTHVVDGATTIELKNEIVINDVKHRKGILTLCLWCLLTILITFR